MTRDSHGKGNGGGQGPKGREAFDQIDARLGDMLGGLGEALERLVDLADQARKTGGASGTGPVHVSGGMRVRVGGETVVSGDVPHAGPPPPESPPSAPYESWTEGQIWTLTAELPGTAPEDLSLRIEDGRLIIRAAGPRPRRIDAPAPPVPQDAIRIHLVNGMLELTADLPG